MGCCFSFFRRPEPEVLEPLLQSSRSPTPRGPEKQGPAKEAASAATGFAKSMSLTKELVEPPQTPSNAPPQQFLVAPTASPRQDDVDPREWLEDAARGPSTTPLQRERARVLALHHESGRDQQKAGFLHKKTNVRRKWNKRFCVVSDGSFKYFAEEVPLDAPNGEEPEPEHEALKESVDLSAAKVSTALAKGEWHVLVKSRKGQKNLHLKAADRHDAESWRIAIGTEIVRATGARLIDEEGRVRRGDDADAEAQKWYIERYTRLTESLGRLRMGDCFETHGKALVGFAGGSLSGVRVALDASFLKLQVYRLSDEAPILEDSRQRSTRLHRQVIRRSNSQELTENLLSWLDRSGAGAGYEAEGQDPEVLQAIRLSEINGVSISTVRRGSLRTVASGSALSLRQKHGLVTTEELSYIADSARARAANGAEPQPIEVNYDSSSDDEGDEAMDSHFFSFASSMEGANCITIRFWDDSRAPLHLMSESDAVVLDWFHDLDSILQFSEIPPRT